MTQATTTPQRTRARILAPTLREDPWRRQPAINFTVLTVIVIYLTWASLTNGDYFWNPYISPLYSPCLVTTCVHGSGVNWIPWVSGLAPAVLIIGVPMGFRLTCYYYRKAYYRAFWRAPTACAVREPHASYTGETRLPLILQNLHRHFSKHPVRYWMWTQVSKLNTRHMEIAWVSLVWVAFTDLYIRLVASGTISDLRFF